MIIAVWRTLLFLWLGSILFVISLPWWKFDGTPHWDNVQWIPFNGYVLTASTLIETSANFLAFIPIGYLAIRSFNAGANRLLFVGLIGFAASFSIEVYQLFCHDRVPGSTDLLLNTSGAVLGAQLALKLDELISFISRRMPFASPNPNAEECSPRSSALSLTEGFRLSERGLGRKPTRDYLLSWTMKASSRLNLARR